MDSWVFVVKSWDSVVFSWEIVMEAEEAMVWVALMVFGSTLDRENDSPDFFTSRGDPPPLPKKRQQVWS